MPPETPTRTVRPRERRHGRSRRRAVRAVHALARRRSDPRSRYGTSLRIGALERDRGDLALTIVSPVRRDQSFRRRASRAATIASSYLFDARGRDQRSQLRHGSRCSSFREVAYAAISAACSRRTRARSASTIAIRRGDRLLEVVIDHQVIVVHVLRHLAGRVRSRRSTTSGASVRAPSSRWRSASIDGG